MAGMKRMLGSEVWISGLALVLVGAGAAAGLQVHSSEAPAPRMTQPPEARAAHPGDAAAPSTVDAAQGTLGAARVIPYDAMAVRTMANGGESRDIAHGTLATGETVNLHQSMQVVGAAPNAPHVIQHSEFILVREGELEFDHEVAGQMVAEKAGPGGVIYVAFGTRHSLKNVGTVPAKYFVVAIGGDAK
jgi:mannose-6-phosphate isomerase-like protein (cupin superfamily)